MWIPLVENLVRKVSPLSVVFPVRPSKLNMGPVMSDLFDTHWESGSELYDQGKLVEAIREWREAGRLEPEDADVRCNIGLALSDLGRHEAAIAEWREAIRLDPNHTHARKSLAYGLSDAGYSAEALEAIRAAIRLIPDSADLHAWLGYNLAAEAQKDGAKAKWQEACQAFEKAAEIDPKNSYALRCLGAIQWRLRDRRRAIGTLKAAILADPSNEDGYFFLGECQRRAFHWRGFYRTIVALNELPDSDSLAQFHSHVILWDRRFQLALAIGVGTGATIWAWKRWRKQN
jgi:tetratricopeptide (TPR) repeat protein